jgi:hypothetical protein
VFPPDVVEAGVNICCLLDLERRVGRVGEPLRSIEAGDFEGTGGGTSTPSSLRPVSTFNDGFILGLRIGDNGLPIGPRSSAFWTTKTSDEAV